MNEAPSRRDFIKGSAMAAAGLAVSGAFASSALAQESAASGSASASAASAASSAATTSASAASGSAADAQLAAETALAQLNPQDYDYTDCSITDFTKTTLFSDWSFGPLTMHNRIVKSAAGSAYLPNWTTDMIIAEYTNWAKGGVELMYVEDFASLLEHYPAAYKVRTRDDADLDKIAAAIHDAGAYCGYQLSLMGASFSGFDATTAAQFECAHADDMTLDELKQLQQDFIDAAKFLKDQGFDCVELNCAGNNIGQAFLSRNRNAREDDYGPQSFESRTRFITEIIAGIKDACGADFPVQILINDCEENDVNLGQNAAMTTVEENIEIAKMLEAGGADSLHLRLGPYGYHPCEFASDMYFTGYGINGTTSYGTQFDFSRHFEGKLLANHSGCGLNLNIASEIKSAVSIPVGTVTYMDPAHAPDFFEKALNDGMCDFILMTRPLMVDPEYVNKLKEGRIDEIAPCNRCLHCHFDLDEEGNFYEHCRVNATHMRAFGDQMPEGYEVPAGDGSKNVMVIGGGPAGMEAARIAASRGYTVSLYEEDDECGGLLDFAAAVKGPHENILLLKKYLERQLEVTGVNVVTGKKVDADFVKSEAPDVVIVATGGLRDTLGLTATDKTTVIPIEQCFDDTVGQEVTVVGENAQAIDVTLRLLSEGKHVTIVSPLPLASLDKGQSSHIKDMVLPMVYARGTRVWPNASVTAVGDGEITISCETGVDMTYACDTVIECMDMVSDTSLTDALTDFTVISVGDCNSPFNIAEAIAAGNIAARNC